MVGEIIAALRRGTIVRSFDIIELIEEESVQFLRVEAEIVDGSVLHVRELLLPGRSKYSYHSQAPSGVVLARWDNAPHHRKLPTHPDYKHTGSDVVASSRVSIDDVLAEIGMQLREQG